MIPWQSWRLVAEYRGLFAEIKCCWDAALPCTLHTLAIQHWCTRPVKAMIKGLIKLNLQVLFYAENLENSAVATGLERSAFIPIPKKGNAKECSNYCTIALISHASMLLLSLFIRVRLLATPWTAAYQAPPPVGFSRQEYWSGVPLPSPTC